MPDQKPAKPKIEDTVAGLSDGKQLAIKLGLMVAVSAVGIVATNLANRAIEQKFGDK